MWLMHAVKAYGSDIRQMWYGLQIRLWLCIYDYGYMRIWESQLQQRKF